MERSLHWTIDSGKETVRVVLTGELNENANLGALVDKLSGRVSLDLAGIQRINSPGVREWIQFVKALGGRVPGFSLERCSVAFVNQLNMISNFRGTGEIRSVFAPYYCPTCTREETRLMEVDPEISQRLAVPFPCPGCKAPMELDDSPEKFLSFCA